MGKIKDVKSTLRLIKSVMGYKILDESEASNSTFQFGGCWILADAFSMYYGLPIYVVYNNNMKRIEHFMVKLNSVFLDSDGIQSEKTMKQKTADDGFYNVDDLTIIEYNENLNSPGIIRDLKTSQKLVILFNR